MRGRAASADDVAIAYEAHGDGALALVFVHGWSCDRTYWSGQLVPFARTHRVVAVDLAGHGESGAQRGAWTMAAFGDDVAAVVAQLALPRVTLVGHSMGGNVVVEAARRLPGRVAALVWIDVYAKLGSPGTPEQIRAFVEPFRRNFAEQTRAFVRGMFSPAVDRALVERVAADMAAAPPAVALEALAAARSFEREIPRALRELGLPVVAINPDDGRTDIESMQRHGVRVVLMPGVGHFPMLEDPERFNGLLANVLADLAEREGRPAPCA